jgi:MerR family transcriptional regulator, light-induced transcriptional regulator
VGERRSLGHLAREPLYNTRAVAQMAGVPADTFRAWERRYGVPRPFRTPANQRLYSEQDIGVISWLRSRTDDGMTISQAIQRLKLEAPDVFVAVPPAQPAAPMQEDAPQPARLQQRLLDAVVAFDLDGAERVIDDALSRYSVEAFCERFVEPVFDEIGRRRVAGDISVAVEYVAARLLERRLVSLLAIVAPRSGRGRILVAAPFGEAHEVESLVIAIMLARQGWQVVYLGARIPADVLAEAVRAVRPDVVCLSVASDNAVSGATLAAQTRAVNSDQLAPVVVGRNVGDIVEQLADLLDAE